MKEEEKLFSGQFRSQELQLLKSETGFVGQRGLVEVEEGIGEINGNGKKYNKK